MKWIEIAFNEDNSYYISNPELFLQLKDIIENGGKYFVSKILHKNNENLLKWIN